MPIVSVIYDAKLNFNEQDSTELMINDVGNDPIENISVEELNSLQGVRIIPNSLVSKTVFCLRQTQRQYRPLLKISINGMREHLGSITKIPVQ